VPLLDGQVKTLLADRFLDGRHRCRSGFSNSTFVHEFEAFLRRFRHVTGRNRFGSQFRLLPLFLNFLLHLLQLTLLVLSLLLTLPDIFLYRHPGGVP
tara:strand:+ start:2042 stop:2332 length:291 start_codon:yes stop_codon:yes gene_type:complete